MSTSTSSRPPPSPHAWPSAWCASPPEPAPHWHSHTNGQTLYVTDGVGLVGTRDGQVARITAGETLKCPAGEEHWHGATDTNLMAHLAIVVGDGNSDGTTWLEPVTDEQYAKALAAHA